MERKLPTWMMNLKLNANKENNEDNDKLAISDNIVKPYLTFDGKIRYLNTIGACGFVCEAILKKLESLEVLAIGFDLEWPVQFSRGGGQGRTALIQLCPSTKVCYLFHVSQWNKLPKVFVELISHPKVRLVGINIRGDIWKLGRDFGVPVLPIVEENTVELKQLANDVFQCRTAWSLDRIVLYVLKRQLDKSLSVRTSNWAKETLSPRQLQYSATDAYASLLVYQRLKELQQEIAVKDAEENESGEHGSDELWESTGSSEECSY